MHAHSLPGSRMLAALAAAVALMGAATAGSLAAPPKAEAATCVYYVKVFAYVHENPSTNSRIITWKSAFARVTGPCSSRNGFIAVYTSSASDGIGWIDGSKLY
jgi:hypothetical protein